MTTTTTTRWLTAQQQRAWRAYLVATTLLTERLDRDLRELHDLSLPEYEILVRLSEAPGHQLRMAMLAESVSHSRSRVTHTVARMEQAGLVRRVSCRSDRRGVLAELTPTGQATLEEAAHTHVRGVRDNLVDLADPEDFLAMGRVFDTVADHLCDANTSPGADIRSSI